MANQIIKHRKIMFQKCCLYRYPKIPWLTRLSSTHHLFFVLSSGNSLTLLFQWKWGSWESVRLDNQIFVILLCVLKNNLGLLNGYSSKCVINLKTNKQNQKTEFPLYFLWWNRKNKLYPTLDLKNVRLFFGYSSHLRASGLLCIICQ